MSKEIKLEVFGREVSIKGVKLSGDEALHRLCVRLLRLTDTAYGEGAQGKILTGQMELHIERGFWSDATGAARKNVKQQQIRTSKAIAKW